MRIPIARAVAELFHQLRGGVPDVEGHGLRGMLGGRLYGLAERREDTIRLGRGRQIDHRLGQGELAFGRTQKMIGLLGGEGQGQRPRIRETTSSEAIRTSRRAMYRGSSPPASMRASQ